MRRKLSISKSKTGSVWWVDTVWTPGVHKSCSITPFFIWTGERKYNEKLMGQDKDSKRSLSKYYHRQNKLQLGKLTKFITNQIRVG